MRSGSGRRSASCTKMSDIPSGPSYASASWPMQPYSYADNNPVLLTDPSGLQPGYLLQLQQRFAQLAAAGDIAALRELLELAKIAGFLGLAVAIEAKIAELVNVAPADPVPWFIFPRPVIFPQGDEWRLIRCILLLYSLAVFPCETIYGWCVSTYRNQCADCLGICLAKGAWPFWKCPIRGKNRSKDTPPTFVPPVK